MTRRFAVAAALAALLALAACKPASPPPAPARPALWEVSGPDGQKGWLFGTIHALDKPRAWRTPAFGAALAASDRVVVEVADVAHPERIAPVFTALATSPGHPPLDQRVPPALRPALADTLTRAGATGTDFSRVETWGAALMLARAATPNDAVDAGIDRAVLAAAGTKTVTELEGAERQLAIFDSLPEDAQRALLAATLEGGDDDARLAEAWARGDMDAIARETTTGLMANPALRDALLTRRNAAWSGAIAALMRAGRHPFVAVGGAHMAGPGGLPARLAAAGFTVRRVQ
ncbi:TraB/GumN family protein [Parablastomonas sp. CN1-191]|uniref:TraB/GumN family protein n=1 Tax=Parablastomonas sp. CN1-191 TaxID=3400908 RepID=UPI003BF791A1